jgi:flagellar hook-associated protein 3 FlgL
MRVTSNSYSETLINQLQTLQRRQGTLQTQIASGQRIQNASDDPLSANRILTLRDDSVANAQYQKNIQSHQDFATATNSALQSLQKIVNRAEEISISADDLSSTGDLQSYGLEVGELIKQAIDIANTQFRGEYIFSGTKSNAPAATPAYDDKGHVQSVDFGGTSTLPSSEVAEGITVSSRIPAANSAGSGEVGLFSDGRTGADLFKHLVTLQNQLLNNDRPGIRASTQADLKKDEDNVLYHVAGNGALQSHLDTMLNLNQDRKQSIDGDLSKNADTDLSEAIVRLSQQQTAYQATLQSAGQVMSLSLLSFLR